MSSPPGHPPGALASPSPKDEKIIVAAAHQRSSAAVSKNDGARFQIGSKAGRSRDMSEGKEGPCGTAQLLEDILRACFGTILVEPIKWRIVSTATPYRSMLRNAIKSGKAAFNERTVEALCALVNAGLRIGEDSSTYDPDLVAKGITKLLKKRGWGRLRGARPAVGRHSADAGEEKSARRDDQRGCRPALRQNEHQ